MSNNQGRCTITKRTEIIKCITSEILYYSVHKIREINHKLISYITDYFFLFKKDMIFNHKLQFFSFYETNFFLWCATNGVAFVNVVLTFSNIESQQLSVLLYYALYVHCALCCTFCTFLDDRKLYKRFKIEYVRVESTWEGTQFFTP